MRFLQATPEQHAAIERILKTNGRTEAGKDNGTAEYWSNGKKKCGAAENSQVASVSNPSTPSLHHSNTPSAPIPHSALRVPHSGLHPSNPPFPSFLLRRGLGFWHLIFEGRSAELRHERGIFYVAHLLTSPPPQPIHALDLIAKIPELYRRQVGLAPITDPNTGKVSALESSARLQERNLALDDAQSLRALLKKQRELEAILDDESESEPVKAEALRELETLYQFQTRHARRTRDSAQNAADTVRLAIHRFHRRLYNAMDMHGCPHPVLRPFADHLEKYILIPSARYSRHGLARAGLAGCFTYEPPPGVRWEN